MIVKNDSENISCRVKLLRLWSEMTQKQFSDYFGIPIRTIQDWESERRNCLPYILDLMEYRLMHEGYLNQNKNRDI